MTSTFERLRTALTDRYTLERVAGKGGMATVYLARDLRHDRPVAVKVLNPELGAAIGSDRFEREILIAASLAHPHILPVHDSGTADGLLYYVMPFVEGESLRQRLDREHQLPLEDALEITYDVAAALTYAHSRGVVHRDIKPENILLQSGHAVVADFGIARAAVAAEGERITQTGLAVGTPKYMSPEQAAGNAELDGRSDLYSLACVLYEMLAGRPPHGAMTPQAILAQKLSQERPAALSALRSSVSPELDAVVMKALASTAADRHATCEAFVAALRAAAAGIPTEERLRVPPRPRAPFPWTKALAAVGVVATIVGAVLLGRALVPARPHVSDRLTVAVFPFRPTGGGAEEWSEALGDLLATALDGTPRISVADPWALWRPLRAEQSAVALAPGTDDAARLALAAGAGRYVLGSVVRTGEALNLTVRVYRAGDAEPGRALTAAGPPDSLPALVQRLAVGVISQVWEQEQLPDVRSVASYTTASAEALKAYLDAKAAMRRGLVDSAELYIDRAIGLDSTFALALVDAVAIKSWVLSMRGQPYTGIMELAEAALRHGDSLSERNRLRAQAMLASTRTDGVAAAEATRRILQLDSTDLEAWHNLAYYHLTYGWQYGAGADDAVRASERVVRLDPTFVPGLVQRATLAALLGDSTDMARQRARLRQADTTSALVRGAAAAIDALQADDTTFAAMRQVLAPRPPPAWIPVHRALRVHRPDRSEALLQAVLQAAGAGQAANTARLELMRLRVAEGRIGELDSLIRAGAFADVPWLQRTIERWLTAAELAGVGDSAIARRAVDTLRAALPIDSVRAWHETYPVWWTGWLIGAWHASVGDPAVTRRWAEALDTLPRGGTSRDYVAALQRDFDARLAARRGDLAAAARAAQDAYDLWTIHTENTYEGLPEPAMRLHMAAILRARDRPDSAAALLRSLVPPTAWFGFLSARAEFDLAELAERRRDWTEARVRYGNALRLWERGGAAVADWRSRARAGLARATREAG